ncbi:MAG TPA: SRPBCC domain-containing protein [Anaerolineales bacterium]|nr:SRPBCC domain-containing protein [Anaerolineales bacterium]
MASVKVEKFIQAAPSEVYRYFTNSTAFRDWICNIATVQPHPGGRIYLCWPGDYYTSGEYIQLENNKFISFTWFGRNEPRPTRVEVSLKKQKGGTLVKLTHRGIGKGRKWEDIGTTYEKEWRSSLENLTSVLETGADLRLTRRPMLGIFVGEFNPDIAKQICVPVDYGIRLEGVLDGMGAKRAGLKKNDVIVALDGHELKPPVQLESVLGGKHAGDEMDVTFYRGSEKSTVKMTLSGRSIPPIPASPLELSKQLEPTYNKYEAEIEALINSASEDECAHKPTADEWSVNEILAHLVHSELGWQNYYTEVVSGHEASYDDYGGNLQARIDGTTAVFKTKGSLFTELKQHDAETLAAIAHLPEDFVIHKGRFWKLAFQASQNSTHLEEHLAQMRAAVDSARKQ